MFGLSALLAFDPLARGLRVGAVLYTALGVLFSLYFMVLQLGFISAFCISRASPVGHRNDSPSA